MSAAFVLTGCSATAGLSEYVPKIVTPYRVDIQQGNFVTLDMVEKLQAGQTKDQVRFILGTPMLTDVFHQERWDFIFRSAKGWNDPEKRRLTVFFDKSEKLEKWEAVDVPKAVDIAAPAPVEPPGFFRRMLGGSATAAAPQAGGAAAPAAPGGIPAAPGGTGDVNTAANVSTPESAPAATPSAATPSSAPVAASATAATPAPESAPGFLGRLFGRGKPDAAAPPVIAAASATTAPPAAVPVAPAVPGAVAGVGNVSAASSEPVVPAPVPSQPASAASATDDKPGVMSRMFGWMRPGAASAVAVPAAVPVVTPQVATASPAPAPAPAPSPSPVAAPVAASIAATAPTAVAQVAPVAPPPEPPAPAPSVTPTADAPLEVRAAVVAAIEQWREAWASKNVAAYLARYEPQFKSAGLTRAEWQAQRTDRIKRPASIKVGVSDIKMAQETDGAVAVSFVQKYESPAFKETGRKLLVFASYGGQWLIREESFLANSK